MFERWNRAGALLAVGAVALVGCDDTTEAPTPDAAVATTFDASARVAEPALSWIDFRGTFDPATQDFRLEMIEPAALTGAVRDVAQPLYCERRVTDGRPDTFQLATQAGSIGFTPTDCGWPNTFPYDTQGMFCFTAEVTSRFTTPIPAVYAEITRVTPDIGHNGYDDQYGTGADESALVPGFGLPSSVSGGLWDYGSLAPGETKSLQWTFEFTPEPFSFEGRLLAAVPEVLNGLDDNCDGTVDELPLAAGEACTGDGDCFHGSCQSNVCVDPAAVCPPGFWGPTCSTPCNCDDGLFCNGAETCDQVLGCLPGTAPVIDDGVSCTDDSCDEVNDVIVNAPNDGNCDNGLFCDGAEICDATLDCQAGTPPAPTDDGVGCTDATCNEATDSFDQVPNDALCDNGLFCDGTETCDALIGCLAGTAPNPDDGVACTVDTCDEVNDILLNTPDNAACDDGVFCNGAEICTIGLGCIAGAAPTVDDGVGCTDDSCDEVNDVIVNAPNDGNCDNGLFCDGAETCDAALDCQAGTAPVVSDGVGCTDDSCDEVNDVIVNTANDANCDNGLFCDGAETCDAALDCQAGTAPVVSDGVGCTDDTCDEVNDVIVNTANDANCSNNDVCDGIETCDATLDCQAGTALTCADGLDCTDDSCDPIAGCTFTNDDTNTCDDGNECTADICLGGVCDTTPVLDATACTSCEYGSCECWAGVCTNQAPFSLDLASVMTQDCVQNTGDTTQDGMDSGNYVFVTDALSSPNLPNNGIVGGSDMHPEVQMNWSDADDGNNCWNSDAEGDGVLSFAIPPVQRGSDTVLSAQDDLSRPAWAFIEGGTNYVAAGVNEGPGHMVYGPYITTLEESSWQATFNFKTDVCCTANDVIVTLDVWDATAGQTLAIRDVRRDEMPGNDVFADFTLDFNMVGRAGHSIETRVYHHRNSYIRVNSVTLQRVDPALRIFGVSLDGDSTIDVTAHYQDGSSNTTTHVFADWFTDPNPSGLGYLLDGLDRQPVGGAREDANDPAIWYSTFQPDAGKELIQIDIQQTGGSGPNSNFVFFGASFW